MNWGRDLRRSSWWYVCAPRRPCCWMFDIFSIFVVAWKLTTIEPFRHPCAIELFMFAVQDAATLRCFVYIRRNAWYIVRCVWTEKRSSSAHLSSVVRPWILSESSAVANFASNVCPLNRFNCPSGHGDKSDVHAAVFSHRAGRPHRGKEAVWGGRLLPR